MITLHMCTINDNCMMYGSWDMEHDRQNFLSFWTFFYPFMPLTTQKSEFRKNEKKKQQKTPGDIINLQKCTINDNHIMYGSWDMKQDRQNFLSFWTVFCPFTLPSLFTTWKIKILKNWKKHREISSFYIRVPKIMIIYYNVP